MKFIAICGLHGSGKGAFVDVAKKHYQKVIHISARDLIYRAAEKAGVKINDRDGLRTFNEKRSSEGRLLVQDVVEEYAPFKPNYLYIFESLRRVAELNAFKQLFKSDFYLVGVDADLHLRYERIVSRGTETDKVSFEKFQEQERLENESQDDYFMNNKRCLSLADIVLENNGTMEEFEKKVLEFLRSINDGLIA